MKTLFRAIGAVFLFVLFFSVLSVVAVVAWPDVPPVIHLALVLIVPFWLTRRIMKQGVSPPVETASVPKADAGEKHPPKPKEPETLEEFEQARAQRPALSWVDATTDQGAKPSGNDAPATAKRPWGTAPSA